MLFDRIRYTGAQKQTLEEKGTAYGAAREEYNRRLWDLTGEFSRCGRVKRLAFDTMELMPASAKDPAVSRALDRIRFLIREGKPLERTGLSGVALREWGKRDLSFPDIEGLRPQEAFEFYDRLTGELLAESRRLEDMCPVIARWSDCGEALLDELKLRKGDPEREKPVMRLLGLFLEAEMFSRVDTEILLRKEELEAMSGAVLRAAELRRRAQAAPEGGEGKDL